MCHGFRNAKPLEDYGIPLVATMENGEKVSVTTSAELEKVLTQLNGGIRICGRNF